MNRNFLIIIVIMSLFSTIDIAAQNDTVRSRKTDGLTQKADTITVIGVGDIMLGTNFPSKAYLPQGNDCFPLLADVKDILSSANLTFGNLEGAFSDNDPVTKRCQDSTLCYAFRTPVAYFSCLIDAGFDVFSLANNHSGDLGLPGRKSTMKLIEEAGLYHAGLLTHPSKIIIRDSLKFGFCAFSPNNGTCRIENIPEAKRIVESLEKQCDILIVSFHGGAEGKKHEHITRETETFYGENRGNVYEFAHQLIDSGADIIFGHGPHVPRAVEVYKNRFIAYSLGNFCTYSRMNLSGINGLAPIIKVFVLEDGVFTRAHIIAAKQIEGKGTFLDEEKQVIQRIKMLTNKDFPENKLRISDDGEILQN